MRAFLKKLFCRITPPDKNKTRHPIITPREINSIDLRFQRPGSA